MSDPQSPASPEVPVPPIPPAPPTAYPGYPGTPAGPSQSDPYGTSGYAAPAAPGASSYPTAPGYPAPADAGYPAPGYPAAGGPGYPAPGYGGSAPAPQRPKGLAITALVLAGIGLVMAFIPFVTWFAGLPLIAAFVMGIVALVNKKQGGKGLAIASIAVSVVGWIVSIIFSIASFGIIGQTAVEDTQRDEVSSGTTTEEEDPETAEEPVDARQELAVVEVAFGQSSYDPSTWWYVAILDNPNEDYIFSFASFDIEALDANGTILDSSSDYLTVLSGRTAVAGQFLSVGDGQITELGVRGPGATDAIKAPSSTTGNFEIAGLTPTTDDYSTTVRGTVSSTFGEDQEFVQVIVVARDAAGAIIGADRGYIERLPTGGTAQFEVRFSDPLPGDTKYEAYGIL